MINALTRCTHGTPRITVHMQHSTVQLRAVCASVQCTSTQCRECNCMTHESARIICDTGDEDGGARWSVRLLFAFCKATAVQCTGQRDSHIVSYSLHNYRGVFAHALKVYSEVRRVQCVCIGKCWKLLPAAELGALHVMRCCCLSVCSVAATTAMPLSADVMCCTIFVVLATAFSSSLQQRAATT